MRISGVSIVVAGLLLAPPLAADSPIDELIADARGERGARTATSAGGSLELGGLVCPAGQGIVEHYVTGFEDGDGGWVESGFGEWEVGAVVTGVHEFCDTVPALEPAGVFEGANVMATNLDGCYQNSNQDSSLTRTFDLSDISGPIALEWTHWYHIFLTFDRGDVFVEGVLAYAVPDSTATPDYVVQSVDLSSFAGMPDIDVEFRLHTTTVVNRSGWYLDRVRVLYCSEDIFSDGFETGDTARWSASSL